MQRRVTSEFIYQFFALVLSLIIVHAIYIAIVRPNAEAILDAQLERQAAGEQFVPERSMYVVMRDYEQESCFILMLWAIAIIGYKARQALTEYSLLRQPLIQVREGTNILPEDASTTVRDHCHSEADRLDSELAMVRYICWAIPSIGFIGTVRGIGDALGQAYRAVEGDIGGVTVSLGVAFNSTFVALVISIFIMFLVHQLQLLQERLVLDSEHYCDAHLTRHLMVR